MPEALIPALVVSSVAAGHEMSSDDMQPDPQRPTRFTCDKCGAVATFSPDTGNTWGPAVRESCTS